MKVYYFYQRMRKWGFVFLAMWGFLQSQAQAIGQSITGVVKDADTDRPLYKAQVFLPETEDVLWALTDTLGRFRIPDVPVGQYRVSAQYLGYEPLSISNVQVTSGKEVVLELKLTEQAGSIGEVSVRAQRAVTLEQNAMGMERSFTIQESKRMAGSIGDAQRVALSFPGVNNTGDLVNSISVRGNHPRLLYWELNGMQIPNPNHFSGIGSNGAISAISENVLSDVTFLTGGYPADYGNALAGVFNFTMRNGNANQPELSFQAGMLGLEASVEGPFVKTGSYLLSYRYSTLGFMDAIGYDIDGNAIGYQDINFAIDIPSEKLGTFNLSGFWGRGDNSNTDEFTPKPDFLTNDYSYRTRNSAWVLSHDFPVGERGRVKSFVGISSLLDRYNEKSEQEVYQPLVPTGDSLWVVGASGDSIRMPIRLDTLAGIWQSVQHYETSNRFYRAGQDYSFKLNAKHLIHAGWKATYIDARVRDSLVTNTQRIHPQAFIQSSEWRDIQRHGMATGQGYVQHTFRIPGGWQFLTGLHLHYFGPAKQVSVEPRFQVSRKGSRGQFFAGGGLYSQHDQALLYTIRFPNWPSPTDSLSNRQLKLTRSVQANAGYRFHLKSFRLSAETYIQYLFDVPADTIGNRNKSILNRNAAFFRNPWVSLGEGLNYGLELTAEKPFANNYYLLAAVSLYRSLYRVEHKPWLKSTFDGLYIVTLSGGKDFKVGKAKNNLVSLNIRLLTSGGLMDVEERYSERDKAILPGERLAPYLRLDSRISYRRNKEKYSWDLSVDLLNTTNRANDLLGNNERFSYNNILPVLSWRINLSLDQQK